MTSSIIVDLKKQIEDLNKQIIERERLISALETVEKAELHLENCKQKVCELMDQLKCKDCKIEESIESDDDNRPPKKCGRKKK